MPEGQLDRILFESDDFWRGDTVAHDQPLVVISILIRVDFKAPTKLTENAVAALVRSSIEAKAVVEIGPVVVDEGGCMGAIIGNDIDAAIGITFSVLDRGAALDQFDPLTVGWPGQST